MEEGYHSSNPYHNAIHAADVTQAMHCFLQEHKVVAILFRIYSVKAEFTIDADAIEHVAAGGGLFIDCGHGP